MQFLVYVFVRMLLIGVERLAQRSPEWAGRLLAGPFHFFTRKHRRISERNLELASPPLCAPEGIPGIVRRMYDHFGTMVAEVLLLSRILRPRNIARHFTLERFEIFDHALARGRGILVVLPHLGNWEIAGTAIPLAGYPIEVVNRPIENRFLDRYITKVRTRAGAKLISKYNAVPEVIRSLRKNRIVALISDQNIRSGGVFPRFFGRPASTVKTPALLALKYDAPLVPAEVCREEGRYRIRLHDPIEPSAYRGRADAVEAMTQAFTSLFEEFIRRHPEQWTWMHRRWRTKPESADATEPSPAATRS